MEPRNPAHAAQTSRKDHRRFSPYSRRLHRGAIGDLVDGRSAQGRFIRNLEAELVAHVGGNPTITQKLLIDRAVKIRVQLDLFDSKLVEGNWTAHDSRTYGGLLNAFRLTIRELGLVPMTGRSQRTRLHRNHGSKGGYGCGSNPEEKMDPAEAYRQLLEGS